MSEFKPQIVDGVRKSKKFAQEESSMPSSSAAPANDGQGNEKSVMVETAAPVAPETNAGQAEGNEKSAQGTVAALNVTGTPSAPVLGNEESVQDAAAAPIAPGTNSAPGQVIALPRRESAAGMEIIPNVVVHTVAGTAAKIVVISSGFGAVRQTAAPQCAGSCGSQTIRMAA